MGGIHGGCLRVRMGMGQGAMAHSTGVIGLGQCLMMVPEGRGLVACHMHRASYQEGRCCRRRLWWDWARLWCRILIGTRLVRL